MTEAEIIGGKRDGMRLIIDEDFKPGNNYTFFIKSREFAGVCDVKCISIKNGIAKLKAIEKVD